MERKNFVKSAAVGKQIESELNTAKEKCITFAAHKGSDGISDYFRRVFIAYSVDTDSSKKLENESNANFAMRKQKQAEENYQKLTDKMQEESDLNKLLTSGNKLFSLCLDFMVTLYDANGTHKFAKVVTIAYDKDKLTSEQIDVFNIKCAGDSPAYERITVRNKDGQEKSYFVKVGYIGSVTDFLNGVNSSILCRRKDFGELAEQDVIFFDKGKNNTTDANICTIVSSDKLTCDRLVKFVAFAQFPANKEKVAALQEQRKQAAKERKQAKKASK